MYNGGRGGGAELEPRRARLVLKPGTTHAQSQPDVRLYCTYRNGKPRETHFVKGTAQKSGAFCSEPKRSPVALRKNRASRFVLRDLAILVLKNSRATPGPEKARGGSKGGRAWLGWAGLFRRIASPTPSRRAPVSRVWSKSEKSKWGLASTEEGRRGANSAYNAAGLPRAPRLTLGHFWVTGFVPQ